jgi:hypothetical protein
MPGVRGQSPRFLGRRAHDRSCGSIGARTFGQVRGVRFPPSGYQRRGRTNESSRDGRTTTRPSPPFGKLAHRNLTRPPLRKRGTRPRTRPSQEALCHGRSTLRVRLGQSLRWYPPKRQTHSRNAICARCAYNQSHAPCPPNRDGQCTAAAAFRSFGFRALDLFRISKFGFSRLARPDFEFSYFLPLTAASSSSAGAVLSR